MNEPQNGNGPNGGAIDLSQPGMAKALSRQIHADIENWAADYYDDGFRGHLGGSIIGEECLRSIWYGFRWCGRMAFKGGTEEEKKYEKGRMMRLFQRGHGEEFNFVRYLREIGFTVYDYAERLIYHDGSDSYATVGWWDEFPPDCDDVSDQRAHIERAVAMGVQLKQWRVSGVNGHFGGSLDGIAIAPERYGLPPGMPLLLEFKTSGSKPFTQLQAKGVKLAKPQHFSQMCTYASDENYGFSHGLYMAVNKDNDILHVEIVEIDYKRGDQMRARAEKIVTAQTPPARLSENPSFHKCAYCDFRKLCHENGPALKNCRSCKFAEPGENKQWHCTQNNDAVIPDDVIKKGCELWRSINVV